MDSALSKSKLIFVRNEENDTVEDVAFTVVERDFAAMQSIRETESAERIKMREFEHKQREIEHKERMLQLQLEHEDRQREREHKRTTVERMLQLQLQDRQRQREQEHTEAMRIISECHGEERVKLLSILWKKDSPAKMRRNSI